MKTINNLQEHRCASPRCNENHQLNIDVSVLSRWEIINCISDEQQYDCNTVYKLVSTHMYINNEDTFTYGVCVQQDGCMIDYALGLSSDYEKMLSFVTLCNEEGLEFIHFRNVIEDFFGVR